MYLFIFKKAYFDFNKVETIRSRLKSVCVLASFFFLFFFFFVSLVDIQCFTCVKVDQG